MKWLDIVKQWKLFTAKVRIKQPGYNQHIDVTINAKNSIMAKKLIQAQYGKDSIVTTVREIK
jgi:hypothetical protein